MLISILLIEDDPAFGELFKFHLARTNSSVRFSFHWEKTLAGALDHLRTSSVDLMVVDLGLPDCSGAATVSRLSSLAPDVPFLVLSGEDDASTVWEVIHSGAEDHILKAELRPENLVVSILNAIARHLERTFQIAQHAKARLETFASV